jgi:NADH-quinone oxidoreductase subunit C
MPDQTELTQSFITELGDAVSSVGVFRDEVTLTVPRERVVEVLTYLRDKQQFDMLADETCVDYYPREPRFGILYQLTSIPRTMRVRVKVMLSEYDASVPSAVAVYPNANWLEREIYDLFGINFEGHPDQRRILLPPDWEGHPLRREIPVNVEENAFSFNQTRVNAEKTFATE